MKKYLFLLAILFSYIPASSQTESDIHLSVVTPATMDGLNASQISKIESKVQQMVTNHGVSGEGYFIIYPKFEFYDETVVEGLRNMHLLDVELQLIVKELQTGKIYNTYSQSITGDGYSRNKAIDQSISQIKTRGEEVENFLQDTKNKILDYYRTNCEQINREATTMINQKRYREAIALLYSIPRETGDICYNKTRKKLDEAYVGYMNETCEENIVKARTAMEQNDNSSALQVLEKVDPESNCYTAAQEMNRDINFKMGGSVEATSESHIETAHHAETRKKKRSAEIKVIAEAQYRNRHQMEMSKG